MPAGAWRAVCCLLIVSAPSCCGRIADTEYDCQLRQLALDYARDAILTPWERTRSAAALALVAQGLRADECNISISGDADGPSGSTDDGGTKGSAGGVNLFVSPDGSDSADGTQADPLKSVVGAQALIRKRYPVVSSRPAITVLIASGDYFFGSAGPTHLKLGTSYSGTSLAHFDERDSGVSASRPITYTAAPGSVTPPRFFGGAPLTGLTWARAAPGSGFPAGVLTTRIPDSIDFHADFQDQLFLRDGPAGEYHPLVRGRTPNGKPWIPNDGFNLTALGGWNYTTTNASVNRVLESPPMYTQCATSPSGSPAPSGSSGECVQAAVVCDKTNVTQVTGALGVTTASGKALAGPDGVVRVKDCLEHLLDVAFDYPDWKSGNCQGSGCQAGGDYGVIGGACDLTDTTGACVNKLDTTYNYPLW